MSSGDRLTEDEMGQHRENGFFSFTLLTVPTLYLIFSKQ